MANEKKDEELKGKVTAAFDASDTMEGFEDINGSTMAVPFVRILQKLSPQLNKQKQEYVEGAEEGDWFNNTTKDVYGPSINVLVLKFERVYIEWKPNRGGFVGYHTPENAERLAVDTTFGNWKTKEGNELSENYVYMLLVEGHENEGIMVMSLSSSAIKIAREWNRLMTTHVMDNGQKAKPYYIVWKLSTDYKENEKGSWYNPAVKFVRYIDQVQYGLAQTERKMLPSKKVDYTQIEDKKDVIETSAF